MPIQVKFFRGKRFRKNNNIETHKSFPCVFVVVKTKKNWFQEIHSSILYVVTRQSRAYPCLAQNISMISCWIVCIFFWSDMWRFSCVSAFQYDYYLFTYFLRANKKKIHTIDIFIFSWKGGNRKGNKKRKKVRSKIGRTRTEHFERGKINKNCIQKLRSGRTSFGNHFHNQHRRNISPFENEGKTPSFYLFYHLLRENASVCVVVFFWCSFYFLFFFLLSRNIKVAIIPFIRYKICAMIF